MRILSILAICAFLASPAFAAFEGPGSAPANPDQVRQGIEKKAGKPGPRDGFEKNGRRHGFDGPGSRGGFAGPFTQVDGDTVAKALQLGDDARVVLTGNIVGQVAGSKKKYTFRDSTGEIVVEIGRKAFRGQNVTPNETVRISGKVDKDFGEPVEIDVKFLEIVKK